MPNLHSNTLTCDMFLWASYFHAQYATNYYDLPLELFFLFNAKMNNISHLKLNSSCAGCYSCFILICFFHEGLQGTNLVCGSVYKKHKHVDVSARISQQGSVGTEN